MFLQWEIVIINCAEKLLEPPIFLNLYTKSPYNSGSESPWRKRENLDIKLWYRQLHLEKKWEVYDHNNRVWEVSE